MAVIHWFRQDLRVKDNTALIEAIKRDEVIFPIFILDKNIIEGFGGLKDQKFLFLKDCLLNLDKELRKINLKLFLFIGSPEEVIPKLCKENNIKKVYANKSYGRYGTQRDFNISQKVDLDLYPDFLLVEPEDIPTRKVFAAYFRLWSQRNNTMGIPLRKMPKNIKVSVLPYKKQNLKEFLDFYIPGGKHPIFRVDQVEERLGRNYTNYGEDRNFPHIDGTSKLAPHVRFGVISIRELARCMEPKSFDFYRELGFRDFWNHFATKFPYIKYLEFQEKRRTIPWSYNEELFFAWCNGETGYPIVDAAMKQLVKENWMHGRARMIVCSFLVKDLLIDWRWGETFFKRHLLDYDENINFCTWQWGASTGNDYSPMRIFSPIRQSERFDPEGVYIMKYLPELKGKDIKAIHNPLKYEIEGYIKPIVDHREAQRKTKEIYRDSAIL